MTLVAPTLLPTFATIVFDLWNYKTARDSIEEPIGTTSRSLAREEERRRREEIPRRATVISTFAVLIPWVACGAIIGDIPFSGLETKCLACAILFTVVNGLRNLVIARFACKVNRQIRRQTTQDRRQQEIEAALDERKKRERAILNVQNQNEEVDPIPETHWIWNQTEILDFGYNR